jgi:hypothetical protein
MKVLAVLAVAGLMVVTGATDAGAADQTARLDDPATTGAIPGTPSDRAPREGRLEETAVPSPARPLGLSEIEITGIRDAIRGQIMALAAQDAQRAWSYLAPSTKDYFDEPATFLRTLTTQMEPLAGTHKFAFSDMDREATDAIQDVVLLDLEGREWLARFTLERQPDGSWGIKTCKVEPISGSRI